MAVTILSIIQVLSGAVLILFVLGQSGKHSGLGMISGASDSFLSKNKAKSADAKLARWTKWVAIVFIVLTLVLNSCNQFPSKMPFHTEGLCVYFSTFPRGDIPHDSSRSLHNAGPDGERHRRDVWLQLRNRHSRLGRPPSPGAGHLQRPRLRPLGGFHRDVTGVEQDLYLDNDVVNLLAVTPSGQQTKSSTFSIKGEDYHLGFGINYDFTPLAYANPGPAGPDAHRGGLSQRRL